MLSVLACVELKEDAPLPPQLPREAGEAGGLGARQALIPAKK